MGEPIVIEIVVSEWAAGASLHVNGHRLSGDGPDPSAGVLYFRPEAREVIEAVVTGSFPESPPFWALVRSVKMAKAALAEMSWRQGAVNVALADVALHGAEHALSEAILRALEEP